MHLTHNFGDDLVTVIREADQNSPFAFVRFGDGERAIIEQRSLNVDKPYEHWVSPNPILQELLEDALICDGPRYFVGVSCPCCDLQSHIWYMQRRNPERTTYANLFVNANHERAMPELQRMMTNYAVISSAWGTDIRVPRDAMTLRDLGAYVEFAASELLKQRRNVLVAAGPLGKAIIYTAYRRCERDDIAFGRMPTMIDIGSALDTVLHGVPTRCYHQQGHPDRQRICHWTV